MFIKKTLIGCAEKEASARQTFNQQAFNRVRLLK